MSDQNGADRDNGRRQFVRTVFSSAVAAAAAQMGVQWIAQKGLNAQAHLDNPDAAMQELLAGNERFATNQMSSLKHNDLSELRKATVSKQEPFAAVLACADSRVPVELIFDQTIGKIFVTRVAGNVVTPEIIASLEYSVAVLGVRALLVVGHTNCGAVKAAMKAEAVPGQISTLYAHLRWAVEKSQGNFDNAIESNATIQAELLQTSSTVIRDAIKAGQLKVTAAVYNLASGRVALT